MCTYRDLFPPLLHWRVIGAERSEVIEYFPSSFSAGSQGFFLSTRLRLSFDDKMASCAIVVPQSMLWRLHIGLFIFKA